MIFLIDFEIFCFQREAQRLREAREDHSEEIHTRLKLAEQELVQVDMDCFVLIMCVFGMYARVPTCVSCLSDFERMRFLLPVKKFVNIY